MIQELVSEQIGEELEPFECEHEYEHVDHLETVADQYGKEPSPNPIKDNNKDTNKKDPGDNGVFCADSGPCHGPIGERCNGAQCKEVCKHVNANGGCDDNSRSPSRHHNNRGGKSNSNALGQIPVIQPLQGNLSTSNSTNTNATTTTVTIPICDNIVGGPCYDPTTRQIKP